MCLELFEDLFSRDDLLNLLVYFCFLVAVEDVVYCLMLVVNDEDFTCVLAGVSALIQHGNVAFYQIKLLQAQQGHIESHIRALFVYLVSVTRSNTTKYRKPIAVAFQIQIYLEIRHLLQLFKDHEFVLLEKLGFYLLVGLYKELENLLVLHGNGYFLGVHEVLERPQFRTAIHIC